MNISFSKFYKQIVIKKKFLVLLILGFFLVYGLSVYLISPLYTVYVHAKVLPKKIRDVKTAFIAQDFEFLPFEIDYLKEDLVAIDKSADKLQIFSLIPFFGGYFRDLKNISSSSIEMFDVSSELFSSIESVIPGLRFKGWGVVGDSSPEADWLDLSGILAKKLPEYKKKFFFINKHLGEINPNKYPVEFKGIKIRANLEEMKGLSSLVITSFGDIVSAIEFFPEIIGSTSPRNYLVVLANNNILRPSGGVLNAYAVFNVKNGKIKIAKSGDMVLLDNNNPIITEAPDVLNKALGFSNFYLKDAAYSSDFKVSAEAIKDLWAKASENYPIDGVVLIDNHFIASLFKNGTNPKSTDIENELDTLSLAVGKSDSTNKESKGAIASVFYDLIKNFFATSMQNRADLIKTTFNELEGKHAVMYLPFNENLQGILEKHNFGGRLQNYDGDYLLISNFNIDGSVSNRFITQAVKKEVSSIDKKVISTLTVSYTNNTETGVYKNYLRIYAPKGSKLISSEGFLSDVESGEDEKKTFFGGHVEVSFGTKVNVKFVYQLSSDIPFEKNYKLLIQKQIGQDVVDFSINLGDKYNNFKLSGDKEIIL